MCLEREELVVVILWKPFCTCFSIFFPQNYLKRWNYVHFDKVVIVEMNFFWIKLQMKEANLVVCFPSSFIISIKLCVYISNLSFMLYFIIAGQELDTQGLTNSMLRILLALSFLPILGRYDSGY